MWLERKSWFSRIQCQILCLAIGWAQHGKYKRAIPDSRALSITFGRLNKGLEQFGVSMLHDTVCLLTTDGYTFNLARQSRLFVVEFQLVLRTSSSSL